MQFIAKLLISLGVIIFCTQIGRRIPALAGLVAVMPLTGLIVLMWLYWDNPGDFGLMRDYTKAALWGILPSILFFAVVLFCFRRQFPFWLVLCAGFAVWVIAALIHQWLLNR